jgi:hypothetical protein
MCGRAAVLFEARPSFGDILAQGIEAGTDETPKAAQPERRKPGGKAMRPKEVQ